MRSIATGYAIVTEESATEIDSRAERVLFEVETLGELRSAPIPFSELESVLAWEVESIDDYVAAIERAHGITAIAASLEARLQAVADLGFHGDDDFPGDETPFTYESPIGGGAEDTDDLYYRDSMVADLPDEVLDRFDLIEATTLDGDLGRVMTEDLPAVIAALEELGHTVD